VGNSFSPDSQKHFIECSELNWQLWDNISSCVMQISKLSKMIYLPPLGHYAKLIFNWFAFEYCWKQELKRSSICHSPEKGQQIPVYLNSKMSLPRTLGQTSRDRKTTTKQHGKFSWKTIKRDKASSRPPHVEGISELSVTFS